MQFIQHFLWTFTSIAILFAKEEILAKCNFIFNPMHNQHLNACHSQSPISLACSFPFSPFFCYTDLATPYSWLHTKLFNRSSDHFCLNFTLLLVNYRCSVKNKWWLTVALSSSLMENGSATLFCLSAWSSCCRGGCSHFPHTTRSISLYNAIKNKTTQ